jgi:hypothetical protein
MVLFRIAIFIVLFRSYYLLQLSGQVMLMTDKRIFISENVKIPVAQTFY